MEKLSGVSTRFLEHVSWRSLERVIETVGWTDTQAADALGLTQEEYLARKNSRADMPASGTLILAEELGIGVENLIYGRVDLAALAQHYRGQKTYLPERYLRSAQTKKRVALNLLNYIENKFGWARRADLLKDLQIHEAALANPDEGISLNFSVDTFNWLFRYDRKPSQLEELGENLWFNNRNENLTKELSASRSVFELLEHLFAGPLEKYLEKNFSWRIWKMNTSRIVVRGFPNADVETAIGTEAIQDYPTSLVRKGMFASLPRYLGLPAAPVRFTHFFVDGRNYVEMEMNMEELFEKVKQRHVAAH